MGWAGDPGMGVADYPSDLNLLAFKIQNVLFSLVAVLVGEDVTTAAKPVLDRAILATYDSVGITTDHRTHVRPAPVLADLAQSLEAEGEVGRSLAARLAPFVTGSHRGLFDGPTTTRPAGTFLPERPSK